MSHKLILLSFDAFFIIWKAAHMVKPVDVLAGVLLGISLMCLSAASAEARVNSHSTKENSKEAETTQEATPSVTNPMAVVAAPHTSSEKKPVIHTHILTLASPTPQPTPLPAPIYIPTAEEEIGLAASQEGCPTKLLVALWRSETGPTYTEYKEGVGWVSHFVNPYSGARGPFQFMPGTWVIYQSSTADTWRVYDSAIGACRMVKKLNLLNQPNRHAFALRWTGADGGQVWSFSIDQAYRVWDQWHS